MLTDSKEWDLTIYNYSKKGQKFTVQFIQAALEEKHWNFLTKTRSVGSVSAVELIQGLGRDTVEKLAGEYAKQCPC